MTFGVSDVSPSLGHVNVVIFAALEQASLALLGNKV